MVLHGLPMLPVLASKVQGHWRIGCALRLESTGGCYDQIPRTSSSVTSSSALTLQAAPASSPGMEVECSGERDLAALSVAVQLHGAARARPQRRDLRFVQQAPRIVCTSG